MRAFTLLVAALFAIQAFTSGSRGDNWTRFRGPSGSAVSVEKELPEQWSTDKNVAWKVKLPGYGWSSPIVWKDKVFVTTAVTEKQRKPIAGFGPGMPGAFPPGGRGGRPGGFGGSPQPGQILSGFFQDTLKLSAEQKKQVAELQKIVDDKLGSILSDEQKKQLKAPPQRTGRVPGAMPSFPQPGQILSASQQNALKLEDEQKKALQELQKIVNEKLAVILKEEQRKQIKDMREGLAQGPGGFGRMQQPPDVVYRWEIVCLNAADGTVLWKQTAAEGKPLSSISQWNTYATETPVTDGERVYAYFGMTGVFCYDLDGKFLWKAKLGAYPTAFGHGSGASPALDGGKLFIQCDNEQKSFLAALDTKTGKELWRVPRSERTGWSTPFVWKNSQRTEIVCMGTPCVRSYDPQTGKQLWQLSGMTGQCKATPVAGGDLLYVGTGGGFGFGGPTGEDGANGRGKPLVAIKAGALGDISIKENENSSKSVAWRLPQDGPSTASPLLFEGRLYVLEERGGFLNCLDAKTGEKIYKERLPGARGFTSSPWAYEGKIFCLDDSGTTFVAKAGPQFQFVNKNALGEMCWSSPAIASGGVFLRTVDHLFCVRTQGRAK